MFDPDAAPERVRLAIAALAAITGLAAVHRAIFAGLFTRGRVRRQRARANHGRHDGTDNLSVPLHTDLNFPQHRKLREKDFMGQ